MRPDTSSFADDLKGKIGDALKNPTVIAGAAIAATGAIVGDFAKNSIQKFQDVGAEVKNLSRETGQSAEDMSRLRFAAEETGVSTDTLSLGIKKLSVDISSNNKALAENGIQYKNASGQILPMNTVLGNVATKFAAMPNGIDKNTLAIKLFGKSGTDLIPLLNQGQAGLAALSKESDKYGLTLTGANLAALQKSKEAHKDLNAAMDGLKVQLGAQLFPVLSSVTEFFSSKAVPVILDLTNVVESRFGPVLNQVLKDVSTSVTVFIDAFKTDTVSDKLSGVEKIISDFGVVFKTIFLDVETAYNTFVDGFNNTAISGNLSSTQSDIFAFGSFVKTVFLDVKAVFGDVASFFESKKEQFSGAFAVIKQGAKDFVDYIVNTAYPYLKGKFDDIKTAVEPTVAGLYNGFITVKDTIKNDLLPKIDDLVTKLKDALLPAIDNVVSAFTGKFSDSLKGVSLLAVSAAIISIGDLTDAMKTLKEAFLFDKVAELFTIEIGTVTTVIDGATTSVAAFTIPAEVVVLAIAAVVGGLIYAYTHFKSFKDVVDEVGETLLKIGKVLITDVLPAVTDAVRFIIEQFQHFADFVQDIWPRIQTIIEAVAIAIGAIIFAFVETALFIWHHFGDEITAVVEIAFQLVASLVRAGVDVIRDVILFFLDLVTGHWSAALNDFVNIGKDAFSAVFAVVKAILEALGQAITASIKVIIGGLDLVLSTFGTSFDGIVNFVKSLPSKLAEAGKGMWNFIGSELKAALNVVVNDLNSFKITLPKVHIPGTDTDIGGETIQFPHIPAFAKGGVLNGLGLVGENGPELIKTNSNTSIFPTSELANALQNLAVPQHAGPIYQIGNITISNNKSIEEQLADIERLAIPLR